jgi:hypothetical protein
MNQNENVDHYENCMYGGGARQTRIYFFFLLAAAFFFSPKTMP